jgi:hypothetical protein
LELAKEIIIDEPKEDATWLNMIKPKEKKVIPNTGTLPTTPPPPSTEPEPLPSTDKGTVTGTVTATGTSTSLEGYLNPTDTYVRKVLYLAPEHVKLLEDEQAIAKKKNRGKGKVTESHIARAIFDKHIKSGK